MGKQTIRFDQGVIFILAGFAGWYVIATGNYFLLEWIASGPLFIFLFVIGVMLFPLTPVLILGGVIFLFTLKRKVAFSPWLAWGVLAAYLFNIMASYLFPPVLSAYLVGLGLIPILKDTTSPNGFLGAYIGIPFFI
jgi:hypothetical protein